MLFLRSPWRKVKHVALVVRGTVRADHGLGERKPALDPSGPLVSCTGPQPAATATQQCASAACRKQARLSVPVGIGTAAWCRAGVLAAAA